MQKLKYIFISYNSFLYDFFYVALSLLTLYKSLVYAGEASTCTATLLRSAFQPLALMHLSCYKVSFTAHKELEVICH